jgi:hypothetical protein
MSDTRLEDYLLGSKVIDGVKHDFYFTGEPVKPIIVTKMGDGIFVWGEPAYSGKIDFKTKAIISEHHNEKVEWDEEPLQYPKEMEIGESYLIHKTGTTTIVKNLNPEFTIQMVIGGNFGDRKQIFVYKGMKAIPKYDTVNVKDFISEDKWNALTAEEQIKLSQVVPEVLHKELINYFEKGYTPGPYIGALIEFDNSEARAIKWVPDYQLQPSRELKNVDITVELIGENISKTVKITEGSIQTKCNSEGLITGEYYHYNFSLAILPFVYDWCGLKEKELVSMKNEKKFFGKIRKGDE